MDNNWQQKLILKKYNNMITKEYNRYKLINTHNNMTLENKTLLQLECIMLISITYNIIAMIFKL